MTSGQRTPDDKRAELLTQYAATGNIAEAARRVNLPVETAHGIVREAEREGNPVLTQARNRLRTHALAAIERMVLEGCEVASERLANDEWPGTFGADPSPQYLRSVVDAHKALTAADRLQAERGGEIGSPVSIQIMGPEAVAECSTTKNETSTDDAAE